MMIRLFSISPKENTYRCPTLVQSVAPKKEKKKNERRGPLIQNGKHAMAWNG